jgi:hypothetical protein
MRALRQGAHVCLIYDDPHAQFEALAPFFDEGLRNGERCIYIADDLAPGDVLSSLAGYGIDVEGYAARGALLVWGRDQWRQDGELRSARKAVQVLRIVEEAILAGYRGLRFAVEMTWTLDPDTTWRDCGTGRRRWMCSHRATCRCRSAASTAERGLHPP